MADRIPVCVVVGDKCHVDTIARVYHHDAKEFLCLCLRVARKYNRVHANDPRVVLAFQQLHRLGVTETIIQRVSKGRVDEYRLDVEGDLILPWPDGFFDLSFNLLFNMKKEDLERA